MILFLAILANIYLSMCIAPLIILWNYIFNNDKVEIISLVVIAALFLSIGLISIIFFVNILVLKHTKIKAHIYHLIISPIYIILPLTLLVFSYGAK